MADEINEEFATYREVFASLEEKEAFDKFVTELLEKHGVDYVRGYVDALKDIHQRTQSKWR